MGEDSEERVGISDALTMLDRLKSQLDEFEKLRETIDASMRSAGRLVPDLKKEKERLEEGMSGKRGKIREIEETILKLEKKKEELEEDLERTQEQISQIDDQMKFISHLG